MASNTPKTMSSRLMTMKFMQRSATKATASSPSTPNGPPVKKARLSSGHSAPGTPGNADQEILQSALAAEERKRQEALDKAAQHVGETKWVLSFTDPLDGKRQDALKVEQAGFAEIDADSASDEDAPQPIRQVFGGGVKRKEKPVVFAKAEHSEGEIESSSEEYDSDDPTAALIRETKREVAAEQRNVRNAHARHDDKSPRGPPKTPHGDMSLRGLTSLSGGGRGGGGGGSSSERNLSNVECFKCGQKGHLQSKCPTKPRGAAGRGRSRDRR